MEWWLDELDLPEIIPCNSEAIMVTMNGERLLWTDGDGGYTGRVSDWIAQYALWFQRLAG